MCNKIAHCINNISLNHLMYDNDTVLISPFPKCLQRLLISREEYTKECDMIFNAKKSKYMCIRPAKTNVDNVPRIYVNGLHV